MAEPAAGKQSDRSTSAPVIYEARDGVSWLTLNRPSVLNALDTALAAALAECVERAAGDAATFVVVVRGAGRAFCWGWTAPRSRTAPSTSRSTATGSAPLI